MYIFWDLANIGMIKIGYTGNLGEPLGRWNSDCQRQYEYLTELPKIPHAKRVERLMLVELMPYHKEWKCERCKRSHTEWFDVSETEALQVFRKWHRWIVTAPYALHSRTGRWAVRPELQDKSKQLCESIEE